MDHERETERRGGAGAADHDHRHEDDHDHEHEHADGGARVAVLLCGYGEVEDNADLTEYNAKSLRLLVSKSISFPDRTIPFLSQRLARRAREEYERANHFGHPGSP